MPSGAIQAQSAQALAQLRSLWPCAAGGDGLRFGLAFVIAQELAHLSDLGRHGAARFASPLGSSTKS